MLLKYELKKLICSKLTLITFAVMFLLQIYMMCLGNIGNESVGILSDPYGKDDNFRYLNTIKETKKYEGEITREWFENVAANYTAYINDPDNLKTDAQMQQLKEEWRAQGYSEAEISRMGKEWHYAAKDFYTFPEDIVLEDLGVDRLNDGKIDGDDFVSPAERMKEKGEGFARGCLENYPDEKGEAFAQLASDMYNDLAENVTWYYDYDIGWWRYREVHRFFAVGVGFLLAVALSPLFTADRQHKTESVIACLRHGRGKLTRCKLLAGFIFSAAVWAIMELTVFVFTLAVYGFDGSQTMIQMKAYLLEVPYMLDQFQATLLTSVTSFAGMMTAAAAVMLTGVIFKNRFATLTAASVISVLPVLGLLYIYPLGKESIIERVLDFFPARLLSAVTEWERFDLLYLFGNAVPMQYLLIPAALVLCAVMTAVCYFLYKNRRPAQ